MTFAIPAGGHFAWKWKINLSKRNRELYTNLNYVDRLLKNIYTLRHLLMH